MLLSPADQALLNYLRQDDGDEPSLSEGALLIALEEYPQLDVRAYLQQLHCWGEDIQHSVTPDSRDAEKLGALNHFLFSQLGFAGNESHYFDPRNSFLNQVIDGRSGLPITLGIVYIDLGRRIGLPLFGVNFPGHFLVLYQGLQGMHWIDPYHRGLLLQKRDLQTRLEHNYGKLAAQMPSLDELAGPARVHDILLRLVRNLKTVYLEEEDYARAVKMISKLILIEPQLVAEYRDRAKLYEKLDCPQGALQDYQTYLSLTPTAENDTDIQRRINALQDKVAQLH